ncbi:MAG: hypothetical protein JSW66_02965 [Phycisphaerales bacterium]|nr:MAG: hypothetical protein JSW66_02965 [Phycisphaerales bacterium]
MKRIAILFVCSLFASLLYGCHNHAGNEGGVEVIIEGGRSFPDFLVGTWKAERGGWEFVFEPDGTISSAVVSLGRVRLKPGQVTTVPMQLDGEGVFRPGPWAVQYSYEQRELIVDIKIEDFRIELGEGVVKGRTQDIFVGSISGDGRLWWAERFSYPEYIADTKKYPNHKLDVEHSDTPREGLLFQKVGESK